MKTLFIVNDAPYGSEKMFNALRLAMALQKDSLASDIWFFLMADAVVAALPAQGTPNGYYNIERMLKAVIAKGGRVKLCGTCCEARGLKDLALIEGAELSSMAALAAWTAESDKALVF